MCDPIPLMYPLPLYIIDDDYSRNKTEPCTAKIEKGTSIPVFPVPSTSCSEASSRATTREPSALDIGKCFPVPSISGNKEPSQASAGKQTTVDIGTCVPVFPVCSTARKKKPAQVATEKQTTVDIGTSIQVFSAACNKKPAQVATREQTTVDTSTSVPVFPVSCTAGNKKPTQLATKEPTTLDIGTSVPVFPVPSTTCNNNKEPSQVDTEQQTAVNKATSIQSFFYDTETDVEVKTITTSPKDQEIVKANNVGSCKTADDYNNNQTESIQPPSTTRRTSIRRRSIVTNNRRPSPTEEERFRHCLTLVITWLYLIISCIYLISYLYLLEWVPENADPVRVFGLEIAVTMLYIMFAIDIACAICIIVSYKDHVRPFRSRIFWPAVVLLCINQIHGTVIWVWTWTGEYPRSCARNSFLNGNECPDLNMIILRLSAEGQLRLEDCYCDYGECLNECRGLRIIQTYFWITYWLYIVRLIVMVMYIPILYKLVCQCKCCCCAHLRDPATVYPSSNYEYSDDISHFQDPISIDPDPEYRDKQNDNGRVRVRSASIHEDTDMDNTKPTYVVIHKNVNSRRVSGGSETKKDEKQQNNNNKNSKNKTRKK